MTQNSQPTLDPDKAREFLQERQPWQLVIVGRNLLRKDQPHEAALALQEALQQEPHDPVCRSFLGLAMALEGRKGRDSIELCEEAVEGDPFNADLHYNLVRVYLMGNHRKKASRALQHARGLDPRHPGLRELADNMGRRRAPVFSFLPRNHGVNRQAGILLSRLGLR